MNTQAETTEKEVKATVVKKTIAAKKTAGKKAEAGKKEKNELKPAVVFKNATYAYIGTIAKSVDVMDEIYNKIKSDRNGVYEDLVKSGETFTHKYEEKLREKADKLKESLTFKRKAESKGKEAAHA